MSPNLRYETVFASYTLMRQRLDALVAGRPDPEPGSSGNDFVEEMMIALAEGDPNPYGEIQMARGRRKRKLNEYPVVNAVAQAFLDAFARRDEDLEILKEKERT